MQVLWKWWLHFGKATVSWPFSNSSMQMTQFLASSSTVLEETWAQFADDDNGASNALLNCFFCITNKNKLKNFFDQTLSLYTSSSFVKISLEITSDFSKWHCNKTKITLKWPKHKANLPLHRYHRQNHSSLVVLRRYRND